MRSICRVEAFARSVGEVAARAILRSRHRASEPGRCFVELSDFVQSAEFPSSSSAMFFAEFGHQACPPEYTRPWRNNSLRAGGEPASNRRGHPCRPAPDPTRLADKSVARATGETPGAALTLRTQRSPGSPLATDPGPARSQEHRVLGRDRAGRRDRGHRVRIERVRDGEVARRAVGVELDFAVGSNAPVAPGDDVDPGEQHQAPPTGRAPLASTNSGPSSVPRAVSGSLTHESVATRFDWTAA
jgi:hypothetical protein